MMMNQVLGKSADKNKEKHWAINFNIKDIFNIRTNNQNQDALIKLTDFYKLKQFYNNTFE